MTQEKRLADLIGEAERAMWGKTVHGIQGKREFIADYLLENGVIVPEIHKSLYWTAENMLEQWNDITGAIHPSSSWYFELLTILEDIVDMSFGAGVLYREKAEAALKEREKK